MHTRARVYAPVRVYMCACGVLGTGKESTDCSPVSAGEPAAKASTIKEPTSAGLKLASAGRRNPAQVHSVDSLFGLSVKTLCVDSLGIKIIFWGAQKIHFFSVLGSRVSANFSMSRSQNTP